MIKSYQLPPSLETWIDSQLKTLGSSLTQSKSLAQAIKRMSDYYVEFPNEKTPWDEVWCQQAQLAYYFPLNFLRNLRVFEELHRQNYFDRPFEWIEFGVGLAPSLEAYFETQTQTDLLKGTHLQELSGFPKNLVAQRLQNPRNFKINWSQKPPQKVPPQSLIVMSYSLTELASLPEWVWTADSIVILEPSTRDDGRKLMEIRAEALQRGFSIAAPCTHTQDCPLLTKSKRDWCHDRLKFQRPSWMQEVEEHLPFSNNTLTVSYLALKKRALPINKHPDTNTPLARVVGDFLDEKGKSRQLICRNSHREFLTFLKKSVEPPQFFRGDLLKISEPVVIKGDELRVEPNQIETI